MAPMQQKGGGGGGGGSSGQANQLAKPQAMTIEQQNKQKQAIMQMRSAAMNMKKPRQGTIRVLLVLYPLTGTDALLYRQLFALAGFLVFT